MDLALERDLFQPMARRRDLDDDLAMFVAAGVDAVDSCPASLSTLPAPRVCSGADELVWDPPKSTAPDDASAVVGGARDGNDTAWSSEASPRRISLSGFRRRTGADDAPLASRLVACRVGPEGDALDDAAVEPGQAPAWCF